MDTKPTLDCDSLYSVTWNVKLLRHITDIENMEGKSQISGKLVLEIMFVQVVKASSFFPSGRYFEGCTSFIF